MTAQCAQYRPVCEVAKDMPLDVRAVWDMASGINNYVRYVGHHKLLSHLYVPAMQSRGTSSGTPGVSAPNAAMQCPCIWHGTYNYVRYWAKAKLTTGDNASGDYTQWTIWLTKQPLEDSYLDERYVEICGQATFDNDTEVGAWYTGTFAVNPKNVYRELYVVLGSVDSQGGAAVPQSAIYSLDIQPIIV